MRLQSTVHRLPVRRATHIECAVINDSREEPGGGGVPEVTPILRSGRLTVSSRPLQPRASPRQPRSMLLGCEERMRRSVVPITRRPTGKLQRRLGARNAEGEYKSSEGVPREIASLSPLLLHHRGYSQPVLPSAYPTHSATAIRHWIPLATGLPSQASAWAGGHQGRARHRRRQWRRAHYEDHIDLTISDATSRWHIACAFLDVPYRDRRSSEGGILQRCLAMNAVDGHVSRRSEGSTGKTMQMLPPPRRG
ncbi:hypothetical protein C8Q77DRAFT_170876 [Trametes polyzona]|nr:hypothetical protein C8Q77DRAFT_170876 [Trametes polyzona]